MGGARTMCYCASHQCGSINKRTKEPGRLVTLKMKKAHDLDDNVNRAQSPQGNNATSIPEELSDQFRTQSNRVLESIDTEAWAGLELLATQTWVSTPFPTPREPKYARDAAANVAIVIAQLMDRSKMLESLLQQSKPLDRVDVDSGIRSYYQLRRDLELFTARSSKAFRKFARTSTFKGLQDDVELQGKELMRLRSIQKNQEAEKRRRHVDKNAYDNASRFEPLFDNPNPIVTFITYAVLVCTVILSLPRRGGRWLFDVVPIIVEHVFSTLSEGASKQEQGKFQSIWTRLSYLFPKDVTTALDKYHLESKHTVYAVCPACHHLYPPASQPDNYSSNVPFVPYPSVCKAKHKFSTCRAPLLIPQNNMGLTRYVPIRRYVSFDFVDWLGGMLARPGMEKKMDGRWREADDRAGKPMTDVFHGPLVRNFCGPDGRLFREPSEEGEGRYLFAAGFDGFNPLGNKAAGKSLSVQVLFLVCLNLPLEERYKSENTFLAGIIPGPTEPSKDLCNPYFQPLISVLLVLWFTGIFYTRTWAYDLGRLVRVALVLVICDILAARKIGGFSTPTHRRFCHVCWCRARTADDDAMMAAYASVAEYKDDTPLVATGASATDKKKAKQAMEKMRSTVRRDMSDPQIPGDKDGIYQGREDFAVDDWTLRTRDDVRTWSLKYQAASTTEEQDRCFKKSGVRASPLLDLPYFDPAKMIVVDSMHNLFLGVINHTIRRILGIQTAKQKKTQAKRQAKQDKQRPIYAGWKDLSDDLAPSDENPYPHQYDKEVKKVIHYLLGTTSKQSQDEDCQKKLAEKLATFRKPTLLYIVSGTVKTIALPGNKISLATQIVKWNASRIESLPSVPDDATATASNIKDFDLPILGDCVNSTEMESLWKMFQSMQRPSWLSELPENVGEKEGHGKLKADQWRTFGLVYLPISLISMWSSSESMSEDDLPQHQQLLDLVMHLVTAITLATSYEITPAVIEECKLSLTKYRLAMKHLFPTYEYTTNDHLMLHLPHFLELWGPVTGWWAYSFERSIGVLQRLPSNHKPGQFEATLAHSFHRLGNLRRLGDRPELQYVVKACTVAFNRLTGVKRELDETTSTTGIVIPDINSSSTRLSDDKQLVEAFKTSRIDVSQNLEIQRFSRFTLHGKSVTTSSFHLGNSHVTARNPSLIPLQVEQLVFARSKCPTQERRDRHYGAWAIVKQYRVLNGYDPYSRYKLFRAKLFDRTLSTKLEVIPLAHIEAHHLACPVNWMGMDVMAVQSLSRTHAATTLLSDRLADADPASLRAGEIY